MNNLLGQISYPVFLYMTLLFFLIASAFSFLAGIGLAFRRRRARRLFDAMNRWISVRKMIKPLTMQHAAEPALMKQPLWLGGGIMLGAETPYQRGNRLVPAVGQSWRDDIQPDAEPAVLNHTSPSSLPAMAQFSSGSSSNAI